MTTDGFLRHAAVLVRPTESLENSVVLITGAASGIGRVTAHALAMHGAKLALADRDLEGARRVRDEIMNSNGVAFAIQADVSSEADCEAMVGRVIERFGRLDVAFNNAGVMAAYGKLLADCTEAEWDRVMDVNLKGVFLCMKHQLRQMVRQGRGVIVNAASAVGMTGTARSVIYPASKHGVVGLTRCAALQYARSGIRINAVCPGVIDTALVDSMRAREAGFDAKRGETIPLGRVGTAEEVAQVVVWLCSSSSSYVTGASILADGGWTAG